MRNSSKSEEGDVHESQDHDHRRGTTCCKEIEEAVNKLSGE